MVNAFSVLPKQCLPTSRSWRYFQLKKFFLTFIYYWETEHEHGRGRERERHRIWSRLQALRCLHRVRHRAQTHKPWDHDLSWSRTLNWLSHPGAPMQQDILNFFFQRLFIFGTERDRTWAWEGQREEEPQNLKQASGSELSAQSPMRGSNSQTADRKSTRLNSSH